MKFLNTIVAAHSLHVIVSVSGFIPEKIPSALLTRCVGDAFSSKCLLQMAAPEPLGSEGDWTAYLDEDTTGLVYYFNSKTGESLWEPPSRTFPIVSIPRKKRNEAERKRAEYIRAAKGAEKGKAAVQEGSGESEKKEQPGWFSGLFSDDQEKGEDNTEVAEPAVAANEVEEVSFIDRLFTKQESATTEEPAQVAEPAAAVAEEATMLDRLFAKKEESTTIQEPVQVAEPAAAVAEEATMLEKLFTKKESKTTQEPAAVPEEITIAEPVQTPIQIDMSSFVLPHPAKVRWGGEDAVFIEGRTFGVFDGVSGADKREGIPLYSVTLAEEMRKSVGDGALTMNEITKKLTSAAEYADASATGASTAVVASVNDDGFLRVLNLGDSTCMVIRNGKVARRSREINHYFECPYQLSTDSPDRPKDGTKFNLELVRGDMIVMASDGVFDNLSDEQVIDIACNAPQQSSIIAKKIVEESRKVSKNDQAETPYAKLAKRNKMPEYENGLGGKLDDSSCIVVRYS